MAACEHPNSSVIESRTREDGRRHRRRYCEDCRCNFSTVELPVEMLEALLADGQALVDLCRILLGAIAKPFLTKGPSL